MCMVRWLGKVRFLSFIFLYLSRFFAVNIRNPKSYKHDVFENCNKNTIFFIDF